MRAGQAGLHVPGWPLVGLPPRVRAPSPGIIGARVCTGLQPRYEAGPQGLGALDACLVGCIALFAGAGAAGRAGEGALRPGAAKAGSGGRQLQGERTQARARIQVLAIN